MASMAEIYKQAYNVVVWLGPSDDTSNSTMDYLNRFGEKAEECHLELGYEPALSVWKDSISPNLAKRERELPYIFLSYEESIIGKVSRYSLRELFDCISGFKDQDNLLPMEGMKKFFTRSWWGRIWVLQEVALPEDVEIMCGTKMITRRRCGAVINAYCALRQVLTTGFKSRLEKLTLYQLDVINRLFHLRANVMLSSRRIYKEKSFPLAAWLRGTCVGTINPKRHGPHHLDASDPRDKILALLSLSRDKNELSNSIVPDYKRSYEEIYAVAMAALLEQGHISLLSMCQIHKRSSSLPTWIPDWSQSVTDMLQDVEDDHITLVPEFNASRSSPDEAKVLVRRNKGAVESAEMACQLLGNIYKAGVFPRRVDSNEVPLEETYSWPQQWLLEIIRLTYQCEQKRYRTFSYRLHAAVRCSIGDVGFGEDGKFARVGKDRINDATILLAYGVERIQHTRMASDARAFLSKKAIRNVIKSKIQHNQLANEIIGKSLGRLPFVTKAGHLVLSSEHVELGDVIALIRGAQVPYVLRPQSEERYQIVSEAYVDGIMDGEAVGSKWSYVEMV